MADIRIETPGGTYRIYSDGKYIEVYKNQMREVAGTYVHVKNDANRYLRGKLIDDLLAELGLEKKEQGE